jgi:hypothetical protein
MNPDRLLALLLIALVMATGRLLWLDIRHFRRTRPGRVVLAGGMFCIALDMLLSFIATLPP